MSTAKKYQYLASVVHIPTGQKAEKPGDPLPIKEVGPGMVSELGLSDAEIKKIPRSVLRLATGDEIIAADDRATAAEARRVADDAALEQRDAEIERQNERRQIERETEEEKRDRLAKLDAEQEKARAAEREKTTAELNKVQGIGPSKATSGKK